MQPILRDTLSAAATPLGRGSAWEGSVASWPSLLGTLWLLVRCALPDCSGHNAFLLRAVPHTLFFMLALRGNDGIDGASGTTQRDIRGPLPPIHVIIFGTYSLPCIMGVPGRVRFVYSSRGTAD